MQPLSDWPRPPTDLPDQVGGRLALFSSEWSALGASTAVMKSVRGLELEFRAPPPSTAC